MPWSVQPVSELRLAFVHQVLTLNTPVAKAARQFGISRKTAYKWIHRFEAAPRSESLIDRSRRPRSTHRETAEQIQQRILDVRDQYGWGARKIRIVLTDQGLELPSVRTITNILRRHRRIAPPPPPEQPLQRFERQRPHELWQCDFKGPLEVERRKIHPFTVLDDHSRYLLALTPCADLTHNTAFAVLWNAFGEFGLPESLLCDNAFAADGPGISGFEARLIRLGVQPLHGRPYHPQTQGKVERLHATIQQELWPRARRDTIAHFTEDLQRWRCDVYNTIRPHEALGDRPPVSRIAPNPRQRPETIPHAEYQTGATLRKVTTNGTIRWQQRHILIGRGIAGEIVQVEEQDHELIVTYCWKVVRRLKTDQLLKGKIL